MTNLGRLGTEERGDESPHSKMRLEAGTAIKEGKFDRAEAALRRLLAAARR